MSALERDAKFEALKAVVEKSAAAPPINSEADLANTRAIAELRSRFALMEKKTEIAISRFGVLHPPTASASPPSSSTAGMGSNQASFAGAVRKLTEKFNAAPGPQPLAQATRNLAPAPSVPLATSVPAPGLPVLPTFPTASDDLKMIEHAQAAAIFGPVKCY